MKLEDALNQMDALNRKMQIEANTSEVVAGRYAAHMTLFNMAVLAGDKEESERLRSVIHDFVDQILDAGFNVHTFQREIKALVQIVERE